MRGVPVRRLRVIGSGALDSLSFAGHVEVALARADLEALDPERWPEDEPEDSFVGGAAWPPELRTFVDRFRRSHPPLAERREALAARLAAVRDREIERHLTLAGPHLDEVRLGDITVRNVEAYVTEPGALFATLLGMTFLSRLSRVDIRGKELVLVE